MAASEEERTPSHPPYRQMILDAIDELDEKEGSNKSSISKIIESTYGDRLPDGHSAALSEALAKLKESGELLFNKNNYSKPETNSPPRRGRGRPPKPKTPLPTGVEPSSPRQRGSPPKPEVPLSGSGGRKRGRPSKKQGGGEAGDASGGASTPASSGAKRGRGRPPKVSRSVVDLEADPREVSEPVETLHRPT